MSCKILYTPCNFSPLAEIPGSIEFLENSLTFEGVQWRKIRPYICTLRTELQIRGGTVDNSKIICLISQQKHVMIPH